MKSYTDIEQSKNLAEILPPKSADQIWERIAIAGANLDVPEEMEYLHNGNTLYVLSSRIGIPCWSLAALLDTIPSGQVNFIRLPLNGENRYAIQVLCDEEWKFGDWKSNPIDACVEMIIKLHEQKLL